MIKTFALLSLIFTLSCASLMDKGTKFTPYPTYSKLQPTEQVDVYSVAPTDKNYIQIGEITSEGFSDDAVLRRIITKAKEVGADGVIITEKIDKGKDLPGLRVWRAIAIKYK